MKKNRKNVTVIHHTTNNYYNTENDRQRKTVKNIKNIVYMINAPGTAGAARAMTQPAIPLHINGLDMVDLFVIELVEEFYALNLFSRKYYFTAIKQILSEDNIKDYTSDAFAEVLTFSRLPKEALPCSSTIRKVNFGKKEFPNWKLEVDSKHAKRMIAIAAKVRERYNLLGVRYIKEN